MIRWWRALRVRQWPKNLVVLAAFFFALGDPTQRDLVRKPHRALAAALLFCLASSAIYLINDVWDRERDRAHQLKRRRPIAAGEIRPVTALAVALGLVAAALIGALGLSWRFAEVVVAYWGMQAIYTFVLKQVPLVDVFAIAAGFVMRAVAGARAIEVTISHWLLLCAFLLALFLALCKRRGEKRHEKAGGALTRPVLAEYEEKLLDQLIAIVAAATIACYAIYTLWPETVAKFQTHRLVYTTPFVIFGLFRYLDLVYRHDLGDEPEHVLLTDLPTIVNLLLYTAAVLLVIGRGLW